MNKSSVITELLGIAIEPTYFDLEHYELNPAEVVKIVKNIGANTIRLGMFSHQGHTYYPSKVAPEVPFLKGRNLLAEFEQECKKAGIRLVVYLNSKWVTDLYRTHPDWIVEFKDGPYAHERKGASLTIYPMCPNSPFPAYFIITCRLHPNQYQNYKLEICLFVQSMLKMHNSFLLRHR